MLHIDPAEGLRTDIRMSYLSWLSNSLVIPRNSLKRESARREWLILGALCRSYLNIGEQSMT